MPSSINSTTSSASPSQTKIYKKQNSSSKLNSKRPPNLEISNSNKSLTSSLNSSAHNLETPSTELLSIINDHTPNTIFNKFTQQSSKNSLIKKLDNSNSSTNQNLDANSHQNNNSSRDKSPNSGLIGILGRKNSILSEAEASKMSSRLDTLTKIMDSNNSSSNQTNIRKSGKSETSTVENLMTNSTFESLLEGPDVTTVMAQNTKTPVSFFREGLSGLEVVGWARE